MSGNKIKFLRGTAAEYTVAEKDNDTIYFTTDDGKLYIGDKEVSGGNIAESTTVTLSTSNWDSNTQIVSVSIVTSDCIVIISPAPDSQDEYSSCGIKCTSQSDGSLSFICSSTPSSNIDVNVVTI